MRGQLARTVRRAAWGTRTGSNPGTAPQADSTAHAAAPGWYDAVSSDVAAEDAAPTADPLRRRYGISFTEPASDPAIQDVNLTEPHQMRRARTVGA